MSLINDALRRAKQVQQQAPAPPAAPPLSPVEPTAYVRHGLGVLVPVAIAGVALLGLFLLWQVYQRNDVNRNAQPSGHAATPEAGATIAAEKQATATSAARAAAAIPPNANPAAAALSAPAQVKIPGAAGLATPPNPSPSGESAGVTSTNNAVPASPEGLGTNVIASTQPEPPKPTPLTLQGIVFNPRRPSVVINGKTLFIGERIGQFRVAAIQPDSATLIGAGRTNVLSLEQ